MLVLNIALTVSQSLKTEPFVEKKRDLFELIRLLCPDSMLKLILLLEIRFGSIEKIAIESTLELHNS